MTRTLLLGALSLVLLPLPQAVAQQDTTGRFTLLFVLTPKPGMAKQLEEGIKRHHAWHTKAGDKRSVGVALGIFGDDLGNYRVTYGNQSFAAMDAAAPLASGDADDVQTNIAPFLEKTESRILNRVENLSRIPMSEPAKRMNSVTYYFLNPGKAAEFAGYLTRLKEAHEKANSAYRYFVLTQILGADGPMYVVVRPLNTFAENTPPMHRRVLVAAFGETEADRLLNVQDDAVRRIASFIAAGRPDLSYTPK
jgi:hypothetical protein